MGYTVKYGPRVEHMAVRHKDAQRNIRIDRLDPRFRRQRCGSITANCTVCPPKCSRNTDRKTPRQNRNGSPQNYSPLCGERGISANCRAGIPRCPALWLATYHYCALLRKAYHGKSTKRCYFCCVRIFCCSADTSSRQKFLWKTILKLWMNCWPTRKMQKSKSNSLPASAKVLYRQKREPERAAREEKNQITDPANESPTP